MPTGEPRLSSSIWTKPRSLRLCRASAAELSQRIGAGKATSDEKQRFVQLDAQYQLQKRQLNQKRHDTIVAVREVMERHQRCGSLVLGGVSMIADDMITFIRNDLVTFGLGVFVFLVVMLAIVFQGDALGGVAVSELFFAGLSMMGLLGLAGWQVTVISSNFISLMLILTMSMNVPCRSAPTAGSGSSGTGAPGAGADDHAENVLAAYSTDDHFGFWISCSTASNR